jgi:ornithine cyclodeaminase/alanine dehydrogenase-like protein (mu-crystallin family)
MHVTILDEPAIRGLIGPREALAEVRTAFAKLARDEAVVPAVLSLDLPMHRGEVHVKGGYLHGEPYFSVKTASGFYGNPDRGLPVAAGMVNVFDATTGRLAALLFDNGYLTELRTGAAGALATDLLARRNVRTLGILGCGGQARYQLEAHLQVRRPERVLAFCRTRANLEEYCREMSERFGVKVVAAADARGVVDGCEVVVTTTPAREPVLRADWVAPGTHVTAIGSDLPGKQELEPALLERADKVVADRLAQARAQGEIQHMRDGDVYAELGELANGTKAGRESDDEITVADLTGVGVLDAAMASYVTRRAVERRLGRELEV